MQPVAMPAAAEPAAWRDGLCNLALVLVDGRHTCGSHLQHNNTATLAPAASTAIAAAVLLTRI